MDLTRGSDVDGVLYPIYKQMFKIDNYNAKYEIRLSNHPDTKGAQ